MFRTRAPRAVDADAAARAHSPTRATTRIAGGRAEIQRGPVAVGVEASRRNWQTSTMLAMLNCAPQPAWPDVTIDVGGLFVAWSPIARGRIGVETGARLDVAESRADAGLANVALYESYHGTRATRAADVLPAGFVRARWREGNGWSATRVSLRRAGCITIVEQCRVIAVPGYPNATARSSGNADAIVPGLEATATQPLAPSLWFDDTTWHAALEVIGSTRQRAIAVYLRETPTAAFALANLTLGWKRGPVTVTAAAGNLLDARYLEHLSTSAIRSGAVPGCTNRVAPCG